MFAFLREVCGLRDETSKAFAHIELAKSAGWFAPFEHLCFVCERPNFLRFNAEGGFHADDGPALVFPSGWTLYFKHGVHQPSLA